MEQLTKKERTIMDILWNADSALSASEIEKISSLTSGIDNTYTENERYLLFFPVPANALIFKISLTHMCLTVKRISCCSFVIH